MKAWHVVCGAVAVAAWVALANNVWQHQRDEARTEAARQRQFADVVRFVQGAQRTEIQRAGEQVRAPPARPRVDPPWVRGMDDWYRDAGLQPPPEGNLFVWHERRLDALEARVRALEGACGQRRRTP